MIKFDFALNNYWSLYWRGASRLLANAMYSVAKTINKGFLYGRTVGGIDTEIKGHWVVFGLTGIKRAQIVDMGSSKRGKGKYDSNAWFWESINGAKILAYRTSSCVFPSGSGLLRVMMRYI